jgi:hypothetical protein
MSRAAELFLERVRRGLADHLDVIWPGTAEPVGIMVPLSCDEIDACTAAAIAHFKKLGVDVNLFSVAQDEFGSEQCLQAIARAFRTMEDREVCVFESADEARRALRPDERTVLTDIYVELQRRVNPAPTTVAPEVIKEATEIVKKKEGASSSESD